MPPTTDRRVANADGLIRLAKIAEAYEFNRRVEVEMLEQRLDPDGVNLLTMMLVDHSRPPVKQSYARKGKLISLGLDPNEQNVMHDRVHVLAKVKGSKEPVMFDLDVPHDTWMKMPTPEDLQALMARDEG